MLARHTPATRIAAIHPFCDVPVQASREEDCKVGWSVTEFAIFDGKMVDGSKVRGVSSSSR